jgi:PAS domain S-box-containing protein
MNNTPGISANPDGNHLFEIYEHAPIGIVECSPEGRHTSVNEEFCRITGYQREELLIRSIKDLTHEGDFTKEAKLYQELISAEIPFYKVEKRFVRKDGQVIWVEVIRSLLRDREGKAVNTVGIVQDITARRQQEAKIQFQSDLLENVHDAIVATNSELKITSWNHAAEELYGWTADEVLGCSIVEMTRSELSQEDRNVVQVQVHNGKEVAVETVHHHKDGSAIYVDVRGVALYGEKGQVVGYVTSVHDITARKRAEEALQHLNAELEKRVKQRTTQLQKLSRHILEVQEEERRAIARELHDRVGQALSALNINLQLMKDKLREDFDKDLISKVEDGMHLVAEATSLGRELLNELRPEILDDQGISAALQAYRTEYTARYGINVKFNTDIPPGLHLEPSLEITLLRIAQEALTNIARYAKTTEATVSLKLENDIVYLTIADNGVGIDTSKSEPDRIGHGLKIMHERAEAFGGSISIESTIGSGTRVEVTIPI